MAEFKSTISSQDFDKALQGGLDYAADKSEFVKTINGTKPDESGNVNVEGGIEYDQNVKAINHRGYSTTAPENTIPAYILSKKMGFTYVEADVSFTSDGVAVLLHDGTIDRTSNGSGSISEMTYDEARKYDYGSWKSSAYAGTRIPTFEEFMLLCKRISLHPYIELKDNGAYTQNQITSLVETVKAYGMEGKVSWISFSSTYLGYVKNADAAARLGYLSASAISANAITIAQGLQTDENEVFLDVVHYSVTAEGVALCVAANIPLEVWTVNNSSYLTTMNPYITGVTSDSLIAGKILYDAGMVYEYTPGSGGGEEPDEPETPDTPVTPDKTLTSISATYSGGAVPVGTALTDLTGIVVTATYSDGSTATVTGYTLSGEIAEGSNTITVTYEGKTATFIVTGVSESGGEVGPGANTGTAIYYWDLTKSLTDLVSGAVATTTATQDSNGLTFNKINTYCDFGAVYGTNRTFELDVTSSAVNNSTGAANNARLLIIDTDSDTTSGGSGLVHSRAKGSWQFYSYSTGGWNGEISDSLSGDSANGYARGYFNGKTLKMYVDGNRHATIYAKEQGADDSTYVELGSTVYAFPEYVNGHVYMGSSVNGDYLYDTVVTGFRVYDGKK